MIQNKCFYPWLVAKLRKEHNISGCQMERLGRQRSRWLSFQMLSCLHVVNLFHLLTCPFTFRMRNICSSSCLEWGSEVDGDEMTGYRVNQPWRGDRGVEAQEGCGRRGRKGQEAGVLRGQEAGEECKMLTFAIINALEY